MNKKNYVTCNVCDGTGKNPLDLTDRMQCWKCKGEGSIYVMVFDQQEEKVSENMKLSIGSEVKLLFDLQADNPGEDGIPPVGAVGKVQRQLPDGDYKVDFPEYEQGFHWALHPSDLEPVASQQPDGGADVPAAVHMPKPQTMSEGTFFNALCDRLELSPFNDEDDVLRAIDMQAAEIERLQAELDAERINKILAFDELQKSVERENALKDSNAELLANAGADLLARLEKAEAERFAAVASLESIKSDLEVIANGMTGDYTPANVANHALETLVNCKNMYLMGHGAFDLLARLKLAETDRDGARLALTAIRDHTRRYERNISAETEVNVLAEWLLELKEIAADALKSE